MGLGVLGQKLGSRSCVFAYNLLQSVNRFVLNIEFARQRLENRDVIHLVVYRDLFFLALEYLVEFTYKSAAVQIADDRLLWK